MEIVDELTVAAKAWRFSVDTIIMDILMDSIMNNSSNYKRGV